VSNKSKITRKKLFGMVLPEWVDENVLKKLVYSVLGLIFALLVSMLFIWPKFSDLASKQRKVSLQEKERDNLLAAVSRLDKVDLVNDEEGVERLDLAIPDSFRPDYILVSLKDLSRRSLVSIESYVFEGGGVVSEDEEETEKKEEDEVRVKKHKVSLKISGLSKNLIDFVNGLEACLPFSTISDMSISQVSKVLQSEDISRLEMKLTFYELADTSVSSESISELTQAEMDLFEEMKDWYKAANLISGGDSQVVQPAGRSSSLFGD